MIMDFKFEVCDPTKESLLGLRLSKGKKCEVINDYIFNIKDNIIMFEIGLLLFKVSLIFKYDDVDG